VCGGVQESVYVRESVREVVVCECMNQPSKVDYILVQQWTRPNVLAVWIYEKQHAT
jgi:hypothetical protein